MFTRLELYTCGPGNPGGSIPVINGELCQKTFNERAVNYQKTRSVEFLSAQKYETSDKRLEGQTEFEISRNTTLKQKWGFENIPVPAEFGPNFGKKKVANKIPIAIPPRVFAPVVESPSVEHTGVSQDGASSL